MFPVVGIYSLQLQVELLKCLKASLNNQLGIDFLASRPEVVGILALNFGSDDVFICTQVSPPRVANVKSCHYRLYIGYARAIVILICLSGSTCFSKTCLARSCALI